MDEKQIKAVVEDYSRQFERNATPGLVIYHLIDQGLIPEKTVRNYNICRDFLKAKQADTSTTHSDIHMGLMIKYKLCEAQVKKILKYELPKYNFI